MRTCPFCGGMIADNAVVCIHCGRQVSPMQNNCQQDSILSAIDEILVGRKKYKKIALLLCLLGGCLGLHKFYEHKPVLGVIYILTGGLFVIGAIVDFICILMKDEIYYV